MTCTSPLVNYLGNCQTSCPTYYELTSAGNCQPLNIQTRPEVVTVNNTIYIPGETVIKYVNVTDENGTIKTVEITNTTYITLDLPLIYFPHLIAAGIFSLFSVGGYIKDR